MGLLGDVDTDRAPHDAAPAADAPGAVELVVPGAEFMGGPLPVAAMRGVADRPRLQMGEIQVEAGLPAPPSLGVFTGEVRDVLGGGAEASRADHGAVSAGQTAGRDIVPALGRERLAHQHLQVHQRHAAAHAIRRLGDTLTRRGPSRGVGGTVGQIGQD